jgi:soluble lytic murein transglycosylase-like protein
MPRAFLLSFLALCTLLGACDDPLVLGVRAHEFRDRIRQGDRSIILEAPLDRLQELAKLGPGALYYAARTAEAAGDEDREIVLLKLAVDRETGLFRRRAWELLPDLLYKRKDWTGLLEFSDRLAGAGIDAYLPRRRRVEALAGLGRLEEAHEELDKLETAYPAESANDAALLVALRLHSSSSPEEWAKAARVFFTLPAAKADDLAEALASTQEPGLSILFTSSELRLFRLRLEISRRDYGAAYRAIASHPLQLLTPDTPKVCLTDAGKAYLYAPALPEGIEVFASLEASAAASRSPQAKEARRIAIFYQARMQQKRKLYADAAKLYAKAFDLAEAGEDRDAAAWYRAECLSSVSRASAAAALAQTAPRWSNPSSFADIIERMAREALLAHDGATLYTLRTGVAPYMSPKASMRLVYIAGRAVQQGLAIPPEGIAGSGFNREEYARAAYEEVLAKSTEPYYRLLAAYRLDKPLLETPASRPIAPPPEAPATKKPASDAITSQETEAYLTGFVEYGMATLAVAEARALKGSPEAPDIDMLRRLALRLSEAGEYAQSMIVMNDIFENPGYEPSREDMELFWPRPWLSEVNASAVAAGMDEHVLYGLIRSESYFRPAVVSHAGAIGLAQLMPPTAAEVARKLRIDSYNLEDPADNIRLGSAHFAGLLRTLNGRILPSVFAYNAGLTRMRAWEKAAPGFPDDLLLESLSIEETRQYGRNVLWAAVEYGMLRYGQDPREILVKMLGE